MRIAIMGTGAVGGYFGGLLAISGQDVTFIARGDHLQAMQSKGLTLETPKGPLQVTNARFVAEPGQAGPCDVMLFAVKAYDIEAAAASLKPLVDADATVVSVLNGVDHQDRIGAVLGAGHVLGGLAMVSGVITAPGVIRYTSTMSSLRFGEPDGSLSARAIAFCDVCLAAGFGAEVVPDIRTAQRAKFVGLATNAALTSLIGLPAGYIYHDPDIIPLARRGFEEVVAVAHALGVPLADDAAERMLGVHQPLPDLPATRSAARESHSRS